MRIMTALLLSLFLTASPATAHPACDLVQSMASLVMTHRQAGMSQEETRESMQSLDFGGRVSLLYLADLLITEAWRIRVIERNGLGHAVRSFADYHHARCLLIAR